MRTLSLVLLMCLVLTIVGGCSKRLDHFAQNDLDVRTVYKPAPQFIDDDLHII